MVSDNKNFELTPLFKRREKSENIFSHEEIPLKILNAGMLNILNIRGSQRSSIFRTTIKNFTKFDLPTKTGLVEILEDTSLLQVGPDEWLLISKSNKIIDKLPDLKNKLSRVHSSVTELSDQFQALYLSGPKTRKVLLKGCSIDLHQNIFLPKCCAQTLLGLAEVTLFCTAKNSFTLICRSSFANYVLDWLEDAAMEYGFKFIPN